MSSKNTDFIQLPSEQLPELDQVVRVIDKDGKVFKACRVQIDNEVIWAEFHNENELTERIGADEPIAWKPELN